MKDESLRLFIAHKLNDALRDDLKRAQKQLQDERAMQNVRWVAPQNIHLTLKFLGNSNRAQIPALTTALERAAKNIAPFELTARGLGCFPNTRRPNIVWVGLEGDLETAALLARHIEKECGALGFARDDRGFTPHLTLGRVKREASNAEPAAIGEIVKNFPLKTFGVIRADALHLIASELRANGPLYTTMVRVAFET